jgi:hypothetical protein
MSEQSLSARDFGSAFKGFLEQAVTGAPGEEPPLVGQVRAHLGVEPGSLAIVGQDFDSTDHANVQIALDAYLEPETRTAELVGFASPFPGYQAVSLAALLVSKPAGLMGGPSVEMGPVQYADVDVGSDRVLGLHRVGASLREH